MIRLRPTMLEDLDFVLALEHRPDNREFIGQWTAEVHLATMARPDREHLVITDAAGSPLGYLITYDVSAAGYGVYLKRIAVEARSRGTGRAALAALVRRPAAAAAPFVCLAVRPHNARAQRCYRAVGFEQWTLTPDAFSDFLARVDPPAGDCLLMRRGTAAAPNRG